MAEQDKGAFHAELPTALPPPILPGPSTSHTLTGQPSVEHLALGNLSLGTAPASPSTSATSSRARGRSDSVSSRAKGDLTSPRIASLGLRRLSLAQQDAVRPMAQLDGDEDVDGSGLADEVWNGKQEHGPPVLDEHVEDAEAIDEGFAARASNLAYRCLLEVNES